jgi:hypothetical protein
VSNPKLNRRSAGRHLLATEDLILGYLPVDVSIVVSGSRVR